MTTATVPLATAVSELVQRTEQLPLRDFEAFFSNILSQNARRKAPGLSHAESVLLTNINREFPPKKLERFFLLDNKRRDETISTEEHRELLRLVRQLERHDAERMQWLGELSLLRKVPLDDLMTQLGLLPKHHG